MNEEYDVIVLGTGLTVRKIQAIRGSDLQPVNNAVSNCQLGSELTGPNQQR